MMKTARCVLLTMPLLAASTAWAQEPGDPAQGLAFAQAACSRCHAVERSERYSRDRHVPSFREIANAPGMTQTALHVWFQTPHPSMPNLILRDADKENVFAYILSLKAPKK